MSTAESSQPVANEPTAEGGAPLVKEPIETQKAAEESNATNAKPSEGENDKGAQAQAAPTQPTNPTNDKNDNNNNNNNNTAIAPTATTTAAVVAVSGNSDNVNPQPPIETRPKGSELVIDGPPVEENAIEAAGGGVPNDSNSAAVPSGETDENKKNSSSEKEVAKGPSAQNQPQGAAAQQKGLQRHFVRRLEDIALAAIAKRFSGELSSSLLCSPCLWV